MIKINVENITYTISNPIGKKASISIETFEIPGSSNDMFFYKFTINENSFIIYRKEELMRFSNDFNEHKKNQYTNKASVIEDILMDIFGRDITVIKGKF